MTKVGPFRYDHVGSFLRTKEVREAHLALRAGKTTLAEVQRIEQAGVKQVVEKQIAAGLKAVTDGEYTRLAFHTDFYAGLLGVKAIPNNGSIKFVGVESCEFDHAVVCDKVAFNPKHPDIDHVKYLISVTPKGSVAKFCIPGIGHTFGYGPDPSPAPYKGDLKGYLADLSEAYAKTIQAFYDAGLRYLQLDDCSWAAYCEFLAHSKTEEERQHWLDLAKLNLDTTNAILSKLPKDLTVTVHTCRGNYASSYICSAPYDDAVDALFGKLNVDGLFLEFDDARSGDVAALKTFHAVNPKLKIVLGIVSTKLGALEAEADVIAKIEAAAKFVPLDLLCLSGQCGFASCEVGNKVTEEQQWEKVKFWIAIAKKVWKDA